MDMQLATKIEIPDDYWYETYNIPKPKGLKEAKKKEEEPAPKKKDQDDPDPDETKLSEGMWSWAKRKFADFFSPLAGKGWNRR